MTEKPKQLGILEFDLDYPDAKKDFELCLQAKSLAIALWDVQQICRSHLKWNESVSDETIEILEKIQDICIPFDNLVE